MITPAHIAGKEKARTGATPADPKSLCKHDASLACSLGLHNRPGRRVHNQNTEDGTP